MSNNKGVTLIALAIMVIVITIILGIVVPTSLDTIRKTSLQGDFTIMSQIRAKAKSRLDDFLFDETDNLGNPTISGEITICGWSEKTNYIYRKWDIQRVKNEGIDSRSMSEEDYYIIQYDLDNEEVDVASNKPIFSENGTSKYKLSEIRVDSK